jgi:hypothetical protein
MDVAQSAVKEKVIRVVVATFRVSLPWISDCYFWSEGYPESGNICTFRKFASYVGLPTPSLCEKPCWQKVVG